MSRRPSVTGAGIVLLIAVVAFIAWTAFEKGSAAAPEWCYWEMAAEGGPAWRDANLGYLPAFGSLLRPFFLIEAPYGLLLFILLSLVCCWLGIRLLWKGVAAELPAMPADFTVWHLIWLTGPMLTSVRNNQVTAQMMALVALGLVLMMRGREKGGASAIGLSILIKPLPLTFLPYLLLRRRWQAALTLGIVMAAASFLLGALDGGPADSLDRHRDWSGRITGLEPAGQGDPSAHGELAFGNNQSVAAWIVRSEPVLGPAAAFSLRWGLFWLSLLATSWAVVRRGTAGPLRWDELALWLAWTVFAAPFGRYYYGVLLIPAWLVLTYGATRARSPAFHAQRTAGIALPLLAWGGRSTGALAILASATFVLMLYNVITARQSGSSRSSG